MKAVVIQGPKNIRVDDVPYPKIEHPQDAVVRVTSTAICGSDLHLYNGLLMQPRPMVMGHEFMGVVEEIGPEVTAIAPGDRVIVPFPISCGTCFFCQHNLFTHCENSNPEKYGPEGEVLDQKGGALYGYTDLYGGYDGGQAEAVRVVYANSGPVKITEEVPDDQALFLTDIFPTGYAGIHWAQPQGGETVAVFGCGPVGLMAMKSAWQRGASRVFGLDVQDYRMEMARTACKAETISARDETAVDQLRDLTEGRGPDIVVDAVGMEADIGALRKMGAAVHLEAGSVAALKMAVSAVRRGGQLSVVGVYATAYDNFPWGQIFDKGLHVHAGQCPVQALLPELVDLAVSGKVTLSDIITHQVPLDRAPEMYKIFNGKEDNCVKVVLKPGLQA